MFEPFGKIRIEIMRDLIESCMPKDKILVDLGAGMPAITDKIVCKKRIKIDISSKTNPDIVHDLSDGIPLADDSVHICVASEVLEHLYHSKRFISEINRVLMTSGYLILSTPNICSLKYRFAFVMGKIPAHAAKADCFYTDERPGHIRDYNFEELEHLLKKFNFSIKDKRSDGLSLKSKTIIPQRFLPTTFGDAIIIKAKVVK